MYGMSKHAYRKRIPDHQDLYRLVDPDGNFMFNISIVKRVATGNEHPT